MQRISLPVSAPRLIPPDPDGRVIGYVRDWEADGGVGEVMV